MYSNIENAKQVAREFYKKQQELIKITVLFNDSEQQEFNEWFISKQPLIESQN